MAERVRKQAIRTGSIRRSGFRALVPRLAALAVAAAVLSVPCGAIAASLFEEVEGLVEDHKRIKAAEADAEAARENTRVARGDWFPSLGVTTNYGAERQVNEVSSDTSLNPRELNFSLTQLLWDFGGTNASVDRALLQFRQAESTLSATRQNVILDAVTAYLDVLRRRKLVDFAQQSVENIKRQTEIETSRVERGAGLSTDVLQAKRELASAESRLVQAEGALKLAVNRYRNLFGHAPPPLEEMSIPETPLADLPTDAEAAIDIAVENNPELEATNLETHIAKAEVRETRADEFLPELNAIAESNYKRDFDGTPGDKQEQLVKVELTYDFNLGLTATNSLRAAQQTELASQNRYGDARDQLEERVRDAWDSLETAQRNAAHLNNLANISAEFLELARRERTAGRRSLIDVLVGETRLINANSDATSAETDVALAVYNLLAAMGRLETDALRP